MPRLSQNTVERALTWARALRRKASGWSVTEDRHFHDSLFVAQTHDPYSASYAGNITIRRFADRAGEFIGGSRAVLDLGCGPGEITCELARRHPDVQFHGVDHSAVAVDRAAATGRRFALSNATFEAADVARYVPTDSVDLVTMFDAFHHLLEPCEFVRRFGQYTARFLLIEPAGDALGRWRRRMDFDWIPAELDKIRARLEYELGIAPPASPAPQGTPFESVGSAVENRYPVVDYERMFSGYDVHISGTVAGLDAYPPDPHTHTEMRAELMDAAYRLLIKIDQELIAREQDLYAKHWVIYATREAGASRPRSYDQEPPPPSAEREEFRVKGPWDARYVDVRLPEQMEPDSDVPIELTVWNDSWRVWDSRSASAPIKLSYHWVGKHGSYVEYDGVRSLLPRPIEPSISVRSAMVLHTPSTPGRYVLQIDLVEEGVTWFSRAGTPPFSAPVRVTHTQR